MSRLGKFVVVAAIIWFFGSTAYGSHRTNLLQILTFPLLLYFLAAVIISIACVFIDWRSRKWKSLFPLGACILSVLFSDIATKWIRHAIFITCLPSYEAVIRQMESGEIPVSTDLNPIPHAVSKARLAYAVRAQKDTNGVLTVEFLTESGFAVLHSGYLYCSSGTIAPRSVEDSRWPIRREERPKWFYISD